MTAGKRGVTPLQEGRVGDDGGEVVGEDRSDDGGHGSVPAPPEERGREPSLYFSFLDLLPRWEKGFPSVPWSPWRGRGDSPSVIGSVSPSLSVFAFSDLAFHHFFYNRRSVTPIGLNFGHDLYPDISFLVAKEGHQPPYGWPTRVRGAPRGQAHPLPPGHLGHRLAWIFLPKNHIYSKKISVSFYPVWTPFDMVIYETKNMQQTGTGTGHWINMLVPKIV